MRKNNQDSVVENIEHFLNSKKKILMDYCYESIIDENGQRFFDNNISALNDNEFDSMFPLVSVVIITANKIERDSLNFIISKFHDKHIKRRKHFIPIFGNNDLGSPKAYIFKMSSLYILHIYAYETGSNTPGGSTDLVRFISNNNYLHPICIISFGVCYGRDPKGQSIGDVIIPKKLYPWSIGQKITENKFYIKHDNFNLWLEDKFSNSGIYSKLNNFCNGEDGKIIESSLMFAKEKKGDFFVKIAWGNMSTGEAVVSSSKLKKEIPEATHNEKEIGGEMEGYGMAKECIFYANIPCVIIKAICDWGEYKNIDEELQKRNINSPLNLKDKLQSYAAFCAGIALVQLMKDEKEVFLSNRLIQWMMDSGRGKDRIKEYIYSDRKVYIKLIKEFYGFDNSEAEQILKLLETNHLLKRKQTGDEFMVSYIEYDKIENCHLHCDLMIRGRERNFL